MKEALLWDVVAKKMGSLSPPFTVWDYRISLCVQASSISHSPGLQLCVTEAKFQTSAMERSGPPHLPPVPTVGRRLIPGVAAENAWALIAHTLAHSKGRSFMSGDASLEDQTLPPQLNNLL